MNPLKKNRLVIFLLLSAMVLTTGTQKQVYGQEQKASGTTQEKQIHRVKIGPHPKYTRLLLDISGPVEYRINANFKEKKIALIFDDTSVTSKVQSRKYRDKNLAAVDVQSKEGKTILTLYLKNSNTRFFHHKKRSTSQIVLDLKGTAKPFLKTKISKKEQKKAEPKKVEAIKMKGLSPEQVEEVVLQD
ncbi:uncharacterized protein METZ01_LOCUS189714, partial [marine metagenome]